MKKKIFFGAIAALTLTACSNDELVQVNNTSNEIKFAVTTERSTRASNVYCNNNKPEAFNVYALFDGQVYIDGDNITVSGQTWTNASGTRYWPETTTSNGVKFYATVGGTFTWGTSTGEGGTVTYAPGFSTFSPATDVANQIDLLYSVNVGTTGNGIEKPESEGTKVNMNFRHALSQIVFNAKNVNPNLYVEITGVSVVNVPASGTYVFPTSSTTENYVNHTDAANTTYVSTHGTWTTSGSSKFSVDVNTVKEDNSSLSYVALPGTLETEASEGVAATTAPVISLTSANDNYKEYSSKALLLLPTKKADGTGTTAYTVSQPASQDDDTNSDDQAGSTENNVSTTAGTYFLVKCRIWNVKDKDATDLTNNVLLWGDKDKDTNEIKAKDIMIPASFVWEEGMKYIYTFVFGKGNGGYDPGEDPENPEDPTPVLIPITFSMSVDDFYPVAADEIEMETPEEEDQNPDTPDTPAA